MKRCPKCGGEFGDGFDYCLEDGVRLIATGGYQRSDEIPTQVVNRQNTPVYPAPQQPKWIFPVIGILCGLIVALGILAFWKFSGPDSAQNSKPAQEASRPAENQRASETPTPLPATPVPPPPAPKPVRQLANSTVRVESPRDGYLALKEGPCTMPCRTLVKIPHGTSLQLGGCKDAVEVADRRNGRWCSTNYAGYSGWVFDAFVVQ